MNTYFWQNVNNLIKLKNKTQNGVSVECGFNPRRIQNLSSTNRMPDVIEAKKIADVLGVSIEYLITGKNADNKETIERIRQLLQNVDTELDKL